MKGCVISRPPVSTGQVQAARKSDSSPPPRLPGSAETPSPLHILHRCITIMLSRDYLHG